MALVLRSVDKNGKVIERFVEVQHVPDTTSNTLKESIDAFIHFNELSFSNLRGQCYDGVSNMKGEFNGLKTKILNDQPCAFYVHCFAHQLQLALVAVAKDNVDVNTFFLLANNVVNNIGASSNRLLKDIQSFEFVFLLFLMKSILGITNDLSQALQNDDQEIVNVMALVNTCEEQLLYMRNYEGFDLLLTKLNDRFNETSTELLICLASLSPNDSFAAFDKEKLLCLAQLYPQDFTKQDLLALEDQLDIYIHYMRSRSDFSQLQSISDLAKKMVEKRLHQVFQYVYLLIELALVLPVATASMERAFSAMNIIKSSLRNRMGDQWLNDSLVVYIVKYVFSCIDNETIMTRFQSMRSHHGQI
ncbi:uncharacterized protein LOC103935958 [Pyrus x bretschneideri]|uniref:uncharacterized protein LOC103935958 n=1 Tax=Pyrus x bretschneideri TaxID=225117 RepID=UPI00202EDF1C|nr:uncharacterized protein LOC103935958 [Pyrus x bretschneideri]